MSARGPAPPVSPSAADSAGISLCEVGRKLNGSYFIIKASKLEESGNTVVYRAYSPRTANQYALTLDPAELAAIVGPERMPSLFSESMSDRKAAHQAVIDSLQFEDRMLAQPLVQSPSKYSGTPRLDGDVSDGGSDTAGSPSRAPVGVDPAGFLVLRVGRKLNGKYFIITMRQVQHASDPQKNSLHVLLYSPSTSQRLTGVLTSQEAVQLLEKAPASIMSCAPPSFIVDTHARSLSPSSASTVSSETFKPFYNFCLEQILARLAPAVSIDIPDLAVRTAKAEMEAANAAYLAKRWPEALEHFTNAASAVPESTQYRLSRAAVLIELSRLDEAITECKRVVALARRLDRRYSNFGLVSKRVDVPDVDVTDPASSRRDESPVRGGALHPQLAFLTGGAEPPSVIAKAFARMAGVFLRQNRATRAVNALILSLKSKHNSDVQQRLQQVTQLVASMGAGEATPDAPPPTVPDVEDIVNAYSLSRHTSTFKFSCTGCGECCRTSDNIFLSPVDIFRMSRADGMKIDGVSNTRSLRVKFIEAIKYTTRDLLPICQLRPVQSASGQCHFAYPLYRGADGRVLSFEESRSIVPTPYKPVHPSEYNLTEEEEEAALTAVAAAESGSRSDQLDGDTADVEEEPTAVPVSEPDAIMNSYGRPALACRFGRDNMPTLCSTYPIARELSFADFWHDTSQELELSFDPEVPPPAASRPAPSAGGNGASPGVDVEGEGPLGALSPDSKSLRLDEQVYVTVHSNACEGFFEDGRERTTAWSDEFVSKSQSMDDFVAGNDMYNRWRDDDWFKQLVGNIVRQGVAKRLAGIDKQLVVALVQALAQVWYDFDSLPSAVSRPFRSWGRVRRTIQSLTDNIVAATEAFLTSPPASVDEALARYTELLRQVGVNP